ncbi:MAG: NTP transferase domain-containing protein, partial [Gammaproteobacteria bacterium]|nr:NTP transferase domain-containing protein [Gammaproteobacteria bacterium]
MTFNARNITIVILAGGRGSRIGGIDKGLMLWQGKPLIEHILQVLPKTSPILINANRHLEQYQRYGYEVVADTLT